MGRILAPCVALALTVGFAQASRAGWEEGVAAFRAGNFAQAVREFRAVVASQPELAAGRYMLGQALVQLDEKAEALDHLRKAYELEPANVAFRVSLAQAELQNGNAVEAVALLRGVDRSALPARQQELYDRMLAAALDAQREGAGPETLEALRRAARSRPEDGGAWFLYGTKAVEAGDLEEGVAALAKAVDLDPDDAAKREVHVEALILAARREPNRESQRSAYDKAVAAATELATSGRHAHLLLLGEAQLGAGRYGAARTTLEQAARRDGEDFQTQLYLAIALSSLEEWRSAEEAARKALAAASGEDDEARAWRQIGFVNEKLGAYDEAIVAYREAGDEPSLQRVEENRRIARENERIEAENREIEEMRREREALERELEELESGKPPPR